MPGKNLTYVLWSNEHQMWHKPGGWGYTPEINEAARFTEGQALDVIVKSAHSGLVAKAEVMIVAPEVFG